MHLARGETVVCVGCRFFFFFLCFRFVVLCLHVWMMGRLSSCCGVIHEPVAERPRRAFVLGKRGAGLSFEHSSR